MIPYVIINGVDSRLIHGLLIQNLPPITKPKIRTEIEEIDGRDGDIVTTLGYEAYDKSFSIGLHSDYDVDEVIKYFSKGGQIIFSNEIDKVYNFGIYERIDFNKLIRFKTATVTLHVQPFKYDANEKAQTFNKNTFTVRNKGNIISRPDLNIKGTGTLYIYINDKQILTITMPANGQIIIDTAEMNARGIDGKYLNRNIQGDYNNIVLEEGDNVINIVGNLEEITMNDFSRWI